MRVLTLILALTATLLWVNPSHGFDNCVSDELLESVRDYADKTYLGSAHVKKWERVLVAFGDLPNKRATHLPFTAAEAIENKNKFLEGLRWTSVAQALKCIEKEQRKQVQTYADGCVSAKLLANAYQYSLETKYSNAHRWRWGRVLGTLTDGDFGEGDMPLSEAEGYVKRWGSTRWGPVEKALYCLKGFDFDNRDNVNNDNQEKQNAPSQGPYGQQQELRAYGQGFNSLSDLPEGFTVPEAPGPEAEDEEVPEESSPAQATDDQCVPKELIENVQDYAEESYRGASHLRKWNRVLGTLTGVDQGYGSIGYNEAVLYYEDNPTRWGPVIEAIACLEPPLPFAIEYSSLELNLPRAQQSEESAVGAPTGLIAILGPGAREVTLRWNNPDNTRITGYQYRVRQSTSGGGTQGTYHEWQNIPNSNANTTSYRVTHFVRNQDRWRLTSGFNHTFFLRATFSGGQSDIVSVRATPKASKNPAPKVANPIRNIAVYLGSTIRYQFNENTFSYVNRSLLTYSAKRKGSSSLPGWLSFDPSTRTFSGRPYSGDLGWVTIVVTATDGVSSVSDEFSFVVRVPTPRGFTATAGPGVREVTLRWRNPGVSAITKWQYKVKHPVTNWGTWQDIPNSNANTTKFTVTRVNRQNANTRLIAGHEHGFLIRAVVSNSHRSFDSQYRTATPRNSANPAPRVANPIVSIRSYLGLALRYQFKQNAFTDPNGDTLTYSAKQKGSSDLPGWLSFNPSTRTFSGTPRNGHNLGRLTIVVTATDGAGEVSDEFDINVRISTPTRFTATSGPGDQEVTLRWRNPGVSAISKYQYRVQKFSTWSSWRDIPNSDANTTHFVVTHYNNERLINTHPYHFNIRAFSNGHQSTQSSTQRAVPRANITLEKPIGDFKAGVGEPFNFRFQADTFKDVHGDSLAYSAKRKNHSDLPGWLDFDPNTRTFSGTPKYGDRGTSTIVLTATDGASETSEEFDIIVQLPQAREFTATAGPNAGEVTLRWKNPNIKEITRWQYKVYQTTSEGTTTHDWESIPNSNADTTSFAVTLFDIDNRNSKLTKGFNHGFRVRMVVNSTASRDSVTMYATPGDATDAIPKLANAIPDQSIVAGVEFRYKVPNDTFTEPDGDTLYYSARRKNRRGLPDWLSFDPKTRTFSGTPLSVDDLGTTTVVLTASDLAGEVSDEFNITVTMPKPTGLIATSGPGAKEVTLRWNPIGVRGITKWQYQVWQQTEKGTNVGKLWNWNNIPGSNSDTTSIVVTRYELNNSRSTLTANFNHEFSIRAVYSGGQTKATNVSGNVVVDKVNKAPIVVNPIPDRSILVGKIFSYKAPANTFREPDGEPLKYTAIEKNQSGLPDWLSFNPNTLVFYGRPQGSDLGNLTVVLTASDGAGEISDEFNISIELPIPRGLKATTGPKAREVTLTWDNPGINAITGWQYRVREKQAGDDIWRGWENIPASKASTTRYTVRLFDVDDESSLLTTGFRHTFIVRALYRGGVGPESEYTYATPVNTTNAPPILINPIGNRYYAVGAKMKYTIPANTFREPDGQPLIYTVEGLADWASFDPKTRLLSGSPEEEDLGTRTIIVTASDGAGSVSDSFNITVRLPTPSGFRATAGPGGRQVTLIWDNPGINVITRWQYKVRHPTKNWGSWEDVPSSNANTTRFTVTHYKTERLSPLLWYTFAIRSISGKYESRESTHKQESPLPTNTVNPPPL